MSHYDLYQALGLSRSSSSAEIVSLIDARLAAQDFSNPGGPEELHIGRAILGTEDARAFYDSKLDDPNAPQIDVMALRQIAEQVRSQHPESVPQDVPSSKPSFTQNLQKNFGDLKDKSKPLQDTARAEIKRSSKGVIAATAAMTAVVMLALFGLFSFLTSGGGNELAGGEKLAEQMINLKEDNAQEWIRDHVSSGAISDVEEEFGLGDGDFIPMSDIVEADGPQILKMVNGMDAVLANFAYAEEPLKELDEQGTVAVAIIGDEEGIDTGWRVSTLKQDGEWTVEGFYNASFRSDWGI